MSAPLELARAAYSRLVFHHPEGLSLDALSRMLRAKSWDTLEAVRCCWIPAATKPLRDGRVFILGYDPQTKLYCAARDEATARRIIENTRENQDRERSGACEIQRLAFERIFGRAYGLETQERLF